MSNHAFIIGYKNHAERIILEVLKYLFFNKIYVYHPEIKNKDTKKISSKIEYTDDFSTVCNCFCFFICSPSDTHFKYIKKIISLKKNKSKFYIYCEKPIAVSQKELNWLKKENKKLYPFLFVGFNQKYSNFATEANNYIKNGILGLPITAVFESTHGLAFKSNSKDNWRFVDDKIFSRLMGNLGIHYIHLSLSLFGPIKNFNLLENNIDRKNNNDTSLLNIKHYSGVLTSIFLSYSTIYSKRQNIFFTDGSISQIDKRLTIKSPRDVFNKKGEFISPPELVIKNNKSSRDSTLGLSIEHFVKVALSGQDFEENDFLRSLQASEIILKIYKK